MAAGAVLFALGGGGIEMVAAAGVLGGDPDGLERGANVAGTLRRNTAGGAVVVSQVAVGQKLHGLVPGPVAMADAAAAGLEQTSATAIAEDGRATLAAGGLVCVRRGRLARGMSADRGQRTRTEVRGPPEDRAAIVRDDVAAHGHGPALGFSHRARDCERTSASGRDAAGFSEAIVAGRVRRLLGLLVLSSNPGGAAELLVARGGQCAFVAEAGLHRAGRTRHGVL